MNRLQHRILHMGIGCSIGAMIFVVGSIVMQAAIAQIQQKGSSTSGSASAAKRQQLDLNRRKTELEVQKTDLEIKKLQALNNLELEKTKLEVAKLKELKDLEIAKLEAKKLAGETFLPPWLTSIVTTVVGVLVGVLGAFGAFRVAKRQMRGALDQSVHEKRLELYPNLVRATEPLAVHFPPQATINDEICKKIGEGLRSWYFQGGGIFLSKEAQAAYFKLSRALTRAWVAKKKLNVPLFPDDAENISVEKVNNYKSELWKVEAGDVESWSFGVAAKETGAEKFRDFVFLQQLSSTLRTQLSQDLQSRRLPADQSTDRAAPGKAAARVSTDGKSNHHGEQPGQSRAIELSERI